MRNPPDEKTCLTAISALGRLIQADAVRQLLAEDNSLPETEEFINAITEIIKEDDADAKTDTA